MKITDLNGKNVCILGFGKEGQATYATLGRYAPKAHVTVADGNPNVTAPDGVPVITGPDYLEKLDGFDAIIKSPGIPWTPGEPLRSKLTSGTEIFLDSLPENVQVIGVTGTKGKSTTSNLIYQVLKAGGIDAFLAGNIGEPMLGFLEQARPGVTFVLELSSYQLETLKTSPHIAVVTSFFPDHLDYHKGVKNYHEAKKNIARYQKPGDIVFYNPSYKECLEIASLSAGEHVPFVPEDYPGKPNPRVAGRQNTSNLAAAYKVARYCGVDEAVAVRALEEAKGLPHRQEPLGTHGGINWVDDSAANTPEAAVSAIQTLGDTVDTIIIGGLDRGYDLTELAKTLASTNIPNLIIFPETGPKLRDLIEAMPGHQPKAFFETTDMVEAVRYAADHTEKGKTVLLSNGAPSYNLFKNFTERARTFKEAIEAL
ncbi:MAG TPA: UDP-N-acetylmuramoyl-L-alanine--D-glutamate ligase [Candidatus Saccharimonadia bacterium]|nr:UDP-N-acetylmuramoyl-L-alanine--D-glutamate ligase [Candidatus Saccharimonadia bacterium]